MSIKAGRWVRATRGTDRGSIDRRTHPNFEDPAYQDADETGLYTPPDPLETDTEQLYEKAGDIAIHHPERYEDTSTYGINYPLDTRETTEEVKTRYEDKDNLVPPRGRETQTMWPELPGEENAYQSESGLDIMSEGPSSLRGLNGPGYPPTELDTSPEWPETNMGRASGKVRAGRQGVSVRVSLGLSEEKGHE